MMKLTMRVALAGLSAALFCASYGALAQAGNGGNGQGGTGGGNAHGAATAGPTYRGDPATGPMASSWSMPAMNDKKMDAPSMSKIDSPASDAQMSQ